MPGGVTAMNRWRPTKGGLMANDGCQRGRKAGVNWWSKDEGACAAGDERGVAASMYTEKHTPTH